jgi:hypothetical protein
VPVKKADSVFACGLRVSARRDGLAAQHFADRGPLLLALSLMLAWVFAYQHVKRMDGV